MNGVFAALSLWFENRRKAKEVQRRDAGWDFAAGEVLRGVDIDKIRAQVLCGQFFTGPNPFDEGALECLLVAERQAAWRHLFPIPATLFFGNEIHIEVDQDMRPPITFGDKFRILMRREV